LRKEFPELCLCAALPVYTTLVVDAYNLMFKQFIIFQFDAFKDSCRALTRYDRLVQKLFAGLFLTGKRAGWHS